MVAAVCNMEIYAFSINDHPWYLLSADLLRDYSVNVLIDILTVLEKAVAGGHLWKEAAEAELAGCLWGFVTVGDKIVH
jgi:hypothetical protein